MTPDERAALDEALKKSAVAEEQTRQQMFNSLVALEKMCNAVTEHLTADKRPPEQSAEQPAETERTSAVASQESLDKIGQVVAKHHQALGLLATFGMMKDKPKLGADPARKVARLLGMSACRNCVGTGWVAQDETCDECDCTGYIKA